MRAFVLNVVKMSWTNKAVLGAVCFSSKFAMFGCLSPQTGEHQAYANTTLGSGPFSLFDLSAFPILPDANPAGQLGNY